MNEQIDIDAAMELDKPGMRSLNTTSELQVQIDLCASGAIALTAFYMNVAFELGVVATEDWTYLQQNNCIPSIEMVQKLLAVIDVWKVVNTSSLHTFLADSDVCDELRDR